MQRVTTPKKIPISLKVITFFSNMASGNDNPTTAIIKAMAVPKGMPLLTKTWTTGKIPEALEYMGTAKTVAATALIPSDHHQGIDHHALFRPLVARAAPEIHDLLAGS